MSDSQVHVPAPKKGSGLSPQAIDLIKQFVLWNVIAGVITGVGNFIAIKFFWGTYLGAFGALGLGAGYGVGAIVSGLVVAAIIGAIAGYIVVMWWKPIIGFLSGITGGWLSTPFRLFFVVPVVISVLVGITSLIAVNLFFVVSIVADIIARYVFAINAEKAMKKDGII